jgi:hypothetical protein
MRGGHQFNTADLASGHDCVAAMRAAHQIDAPVQALMPQAHRQHRLASAGERAPARAAAAGGIMSA